MNSFILFRLHALALPLYLVTTNLTHAIACADALRVAWLD